MLGTLLVTTMLEVRALVGRNRHASARYDALARELLRLILLACSIAAIVGGMLLFSLLVLYPALTTYLASVFRSVFLLYGLLILVFTLIVYAYYFSWQDMNTGWAKWIHASLGVGANGTGTILALLGNAWSSFMVSPAGVDAQGHFLGNSWHAIHTALWNPFNVHRVVGHLLFGAAVLAAYAAYRALTAKVAEDKAHFDWVADIAFLFMVGALFTIPFGGYWLLREMYAYRQQMGITLLGGLLAWPGVILVTLMGFLFLAINYYLWQRINTPAGAEPYGRYAKYVFFLLALCMTVYITPHTMVMSPLELKTMGGQQHQVLGNYGVESAKSTAVNLMIVITVASFALWRLSRGGFMTEESRIPDKMLVVAFLVGAVNILWLGIYGYYIPANVRVGLSVPMVATTLSLILIGLTMVIRLQRTDPEPQPVWAMPSNRGYLLCSSSRLS